MLERSSWRGLGAWIRPWLGRWRALTYALLVITLDWPALVHAWWYSDDYWLAEAKGLWIQRGLQNGRPLEGLWFTTFAFDRSPEHGLANIVLRLVQVALHVGTAVVVSRLVARHTRPWVAAVAPLPFLLWCFHGESVLWRTAAAYPLAALLSTSGVALILAGRARWSLIGAALCAAAMLTNQAAAAAGIVCWLGIGALRRMEPPTGPRPPARSSCRRELAWLALGYMVGGVASVYCARVALNQDPRAAFADSPWSRLQLLAQMNRLFLWFPAFYPRFVVGSHALMALALSVTVASLGRKGASVRTATALAAALAAALVAPYLTLLMTTNEWPTFRLFYAAPLGFGILWALAVGIAKRALRALLTAALVATLAGHAVVARVMAGEYVASAHAEAQVALDLERAAAKLGARRVVSVERPREVGAIHWSASGEYNPFGFHYSFANGHNAAFVIPWAWPTVVRWLTRLQPVRDGALEVQCEAIARELPPEPPFQFRPLPGSDVVCVCPR